MQLLRRRHVLGVRLERLQQLSVRAVPGEFLPKRLHQLPGRHVQVQLRSMGLPMRCMSALPRRPDALRLWWI